MIEQYLDALRGELAGADPALVQDALYDAEEFLRSEMADCAGDPEACLAEVVERYGSPAEVAAAYRETEVTVRRALAPPRPRAERGPLARFFGVVADPYAWASLFYMVLAFVTGIVYFVLLSVMLPLGIGLLPIGVGILVLLMFFATVRAVGFAEGRLVEALLGVRMPRRPRATVQQGDVFARIKHWFADWRTWTTMLYMLLQLVLGSVYFSLIVGALAISTSAVVYPVAQLFTDYPLVQIGSYGYILQPWATPLVMGAGLLGYVLTLHLCKGIGVLHAAYAKALLVGRYTDAPADGGAQG